jgi:hypothetical protein
MKRRLPVRLFVANWLIVVRPCHDAALSCESDLLDAGNS